VASPVAGPGLGSPLVGSPATPGRSVPRILPPAVVRALRTTYLLLAALAAAGAVLLPALVTHGRPSRRRKELPS
jgi:hypothetical protein